MFIKALNNTLYGWGLLSSILEGTTHLHSFVRGRGVLYTDFEGQRDFFGIQRRSCLFIL